MFQFSYQVLSQIEQNLSYFLFFTSFKQDAFLILIIH